MGKGTKEERVRIWAIVPKDLAMRIEAAAAKECRPRSNMMYVLLERGLAQEGRDAV